MQAKRGGHRLKDGCHWQRAVVLKTTAAAKGADRVQPVERRPDDDGAPDKPPRPGLVVDLHHFFQVDGPAASVHLQRDREAVALQSGVNAKVFVGLAVRPIFFPVDRVCEDLPNDYAAR